MRMIRPFTLLLLLSLNFTLSAQEENVHMTPPPPLNDEYTAWMIGEWKGETISQMGKSTDYMKCEMGLNGQFMIITFESKTDDGRSISGLGAVTLDKDGNTVGYWIDSWRTMSEGKGFREGNLSTIKWATPMGTYIRTTERIAENTMKVTGVMTGASGQEMQSETEFKRIIK